MSKQISCQMCCLDSFKFKEQDDKILLTSYVFHIFFSQHSALFESQHLPYSSIPQLIDRTLSIINNSMRKPLSLLFLLSSLFILSFCASRAPDSGINTFLSEKILIELYYQTLCPYCSRFMTNQLQDLLLVPGIFEIATFQLYPFGNGKIIKDGRDHVFTCQHGEAECQGNIIASCALNMHPEIKAVPFAVCLQNPNSNWKQIGQKCSKNFGLKWESIQTCTNTYEGKQIQYYNALATKAASVRSVPTLIVDGMNEDDFQFEIRDNLLEYICKAYRGKKSIKACEQFK